MNYLQTAIDDLPQIPLWRHNNKLYFYSQGTTKWSFDSASQEFVHRLHPYSTYACYFLTDRNIESTEFPTISSSLPTEIDTRIRRLCPTRKRINIGRQNGTKFLR
mgnify:CR=1 FL=1